MREKKFILLIFCIFIVTFIAGCDCDEDDAEDLADDLGVPDLIFDESDVGVATPAGWNFLFAMDLDEDDAALIDSNLSINLELIQEFIDVDLDSIENMIACAKVVDITGYGNALRFANKLSIQGTTLMLDTDAVAKLGDSIGADGAGMYAVYYADNQNGYISGTTEDCDGVPVSGAFAIISGGPFVTYTAADGSFALPALEGYPTAVTVTGADCVCTVGAPMTDTSTDTNPKSDDPADTPGNDPFTDGTDNVDGGVCVCCPPEPVPDCEDHDGDGYGEGVDCLGEDCDDQNADIYTMVTAYMDRDGDGVTSGTGEQICAGDEMPAGYVDTQSTTDDCNDSDVNLYQNLDAYTDFDLDGYGDDNEATATVVCSGDELAEGWSATNDDCDDSRTDINPGAEEITGDGEDNDCNDTTSDITPCASVDTDGDGYGSSVDCLGPDCNEGDADLFQLVEWYVDADEDGYGSETTETDVCSGNVPPTGYSGNSSDCDDADDSLWQFIYGFTDADEDGYGTGNGEYVCSSDTLPDGYVRDDSTDCDDTNGDIYQYLPGYADMDGDTYTFGGMTYVCSGATLAVGYTDTQKPEDCNDNNADVNPDATEVLEDFIDNDCNPDTPDVAEPDPIDDETDVLNIFDFEDGSLEGWDVSAECQLYGVSNMAYYELFPSGQQANYLYVSSGGNQVKTCTLSITTDVPAGATSLEVKYNFISQEYEEWLGSSYNDLFTVTIANFPNYIIDRTVNNTASADDWLAIDPTDAAVGVADVGNSQDAMPNPTMTNPHSNGPQKYDGMLKYGESTGNPDEDNAGKIATMDLPDFSTVTIVITVSDMGDRIYDSAGLIDWIRFK